MGHHSDSSPPKEAVDAAISRLAEMRYGLFTLAEAVPLGATKGIIQSRTRTGRWVRVHQGVYRLAGVPTSWQQTLLAACLAHGTGAVASHHAAAALHGWSESKRLEVSVSPRRRKRLPGVVVHEVGDLSREDVTLVDGIPVTSVARTLIDLAGVLPADQVEELLDEALRRRKATISWLKSRVAALRRPGRRGIAVIERLVAERDQKGRGPESRFERKLLRLIRRAGLPEPVCQYEIWYGGRVVARPDFSYPDLRLAIEADGYDSHSTLTDWQHDLERGNELELLGWMPLHFTWHDVEKRPHYVASRIAAAIEMRKKAGRRRSG